MTDITRPRLLLLTERYAPDVGGVARSAGRIAAALSDLGIRIDVLAWTKSLQPGQLETTPEADPNEGGKSRTIHRLGLFANWDLSLQHTFNVLEWLHADRHYDVVWGHYVYPAGFAAVVFGETQGIPSTVSARGNDIDRLMFPPGDFARLLWTMERASVVSTVSRGLGKKIDVLLGRASSTIPLPNVADVDVFRPRTRAVAQQQRTKRGIASEELVLGFCGELRHKKGLPFLLTSLRDLNQVRPTRLLVIGSVRPREQRQLTIFSHEYPLLREQITVTGHQENPSDVADWLHVCDVVLCPSLWDGVPNALLEAMACGKLVIASNAGGIPEIIEHGNNGVLIPKEQLHRLGEVVLETLHLPTSDREAISSNARSFAEQLVRTAAERNALECVLRQLLPSFQPGKSGR